MNKIIAQKIKERREEKNITQKELAEHLGKNAVSISDIERNRVEVSASELHEISKFLEKPIEYFYGEEIKNTEIQDILARLKSHSPTDIKDIYKPIKHIIDLKDIENEGKKFPPNQKIPDDKLLEIFSRTVPLAKTQNEMNEKINKILNMISNEMKVRNLKTPKI